ncbi:MAG: GDP-mannose 4,6-dehydratase, partial [Candidatus Firestonebacteria bacterium]|nr:GDP-mannose 4,6-dehydratase [Candidatus Firestonebacteria bacterium]
EIDTKLFRPSEVNVLLGDAKKAKEKLGWQPTISFHDLVKEMLEEDLEYIGQHKS